MGKLIRISTAALLLLSAACTTSQQTEPPLASPSEFALSLRVTATPDVISQNGSSTSTIEVSALGPDGRPPSRPLQFRMDMALDATPTCAMKVAGTVLCVQDFGTLSARTLPTNSQGKATATYTAPLASPVAGGVGTVVTIVATPIPDSDGNYQTTNQQIATIRLVPLGVIHPPGGTPTAKFTMSPDKAVMNAPVIFDASSSDPGLGASQISAYSWDFGDGTQGSGATVMHAFTSPQSFNVKLTVTNDLKLSDVTSMLVAVQAPVAPVADFVFGPSPVHSNSQVNFTSTSTTPGGVGIASYSWDFGDGSAPSCSSATCAHTYSPVPVVPPATTTDTTYNVTLTVRDGNGLTAMKTNPVKVTTP
jgi:PKD repeat protein